MDELPPITGYIKFQNVTFTYDQTHLILQDINIEMVPGNTTAIVGQSGSGKTTLVQLIPRFYEPQTGTITIDGLDITNVKLASLRRQIGFVQQEPFLIYGTILDNIAFGRTNIQEWQIIKAAKQADAHDFIQEFTDGYNSQVGERGIQLSQGQKQRIVLARALFLNTPILILDEATSVLDMKSEAKILRTLQKIRNGQTTIIISHRLSTIKNADCILVIDKDRIVEQGKHEELINQGQLYSQLYGRNSDESSQSCNR